MRLDMILYTDLMMKAKKAMTEQIFFDTDCISSLLWTKQENLILQLFPNRIIFPQDVWDEMSNPCIPHFLQRLSKMRSLKVISVMPILVKTEEFEIFHELAVAPASGRKLIGRGEAAAIALAKVNKGVLASNNLKDISCYLELYNLKNITTSDILVLAMGEGLITETEGNIIWSDLIRRRQKMPVSTFSDYIKFR